MSFPETELQNAKKKVLKKTDIVGLSPKQYVLYRINRASDLDIKEDYLDIDVDSITMDEPRPGENCRAVAVVAVSGSNKTKWRNTVNYRIPQIDVGEVYGDVVELVFEEIKLMPDYNTVAKAFMLPPKVFREITFEGLSDDALSYRLHFNNPFFTGSMDLRVTGITHLANDKAVVDALLSLTGS